MEGRPGYIFVMQFDRSHWHKLCTYMLQDVSQHVFEFFHQVTGIRIIHNKHPSGSYHVGLSWTGRV